MVELRMNQAIGRAISDEMAADERVLVLGEDVADAGGVFKATEGLLEEFGPSRVRNTPISEMAILGSAVGAAATGLRPVAEIMFVEFLGVAFDQLMTQASMMRYLSGGQFQCPLVVRAAVGSGVGFGAQHSQTLETWMNSTPGIKLCVASGPDSAYRLLRAAIRDPDPVVVLEPKALYGVRGDVDLDAGIPALGQARIVREGTDVTIVALGQTVRIAEEAAEHLATSAEVIDLQSLLPWDRALVIESVAKTRRLVTVEESPFTAGWGTEISSYVSSHLFRSLHDPVVRITTPDVPVPFSVRLEGAFLPSSEVIVGQVEELLSTGKVPQLWWSTGGGR